MKSLLLLFLLTIATLSHAQDQTTFVLVRHAEKADDGTKNPPLNEEGKERAKKLATFLENQNVTVLYATPFKRTQSTLRPLAERMNLEIQTYDPFPEDDWFNELYEKYPGETIVIAGHSNTIPVIANTLMGSEELKEFDESDYGNLLIVVGNEVGDGKLLWLTF